MSAADDHRDTTKQSDALLWLGGVVVVGMGVTWLVLSKPWAGEQTDVYSPVPVQASTQTSAQPETGAAETRLETPLEDNPLRMAQLALETGMLVEPVEYSAWTLFRKALEQDPGSAEARQGLEAIAAELLRRANAAVEQGRFDDARETIQRIREAIPVHTGANDLAIRIDSLTRRAALQRPAVVDVADDEDEPEAADEPVATASAPQASEPEPEEAPAPPPVDPIIALNEAFLAALAANQLLTPPGESAKDYLGAMSAIDASHELTGQARSLLFQQFMSRARQAIVEMDTAAAETWIDEAEGLAVDPETVTAARGELQTRLIEAESARRVPASSLKITSYTPPQYPSRALERAIEGWVDLEFVVAKDGSTREIVVTDASHNSYFRDEAVAAIERWVFEPRVFMGETIEQRAYTRIRFDFR